MHGKRAIPTDPDSCIMKDEAVDVVFKMDDGNLSETAYIAPLVDRSTIFQGTHHHLNRKLCITGTITLEGLMRTRMYLST